MSRIKRRDQTQNIEDNKIAMKFDIAMLNSLIKYTLSSNVTKMGLGNLSKLFDYLDYDGYKYNNGIRDRIMFIKYLLDALLVHNLKDYDIIRSYIVNQDQELESLVNDTTWGDNLLTPSECRMIEKSISSRLQYIYLLQARSVLDDVYREVDRAEFITYDEIAHKLREELQRVLINVQNCTIGGGLLRQFSLSADNVADMINFIVQKTQSPEAILQTGIRQLNAILSPGFQAERLYVFLGFSGKFKSGTLLNMADQIRKFNPQLKAVENGKRKTILFVTMENSIEETIVRLFDMYSSVDSDILDVTPEFVLNTLRNEGRYQFTDDSGIDIEFRYYANMEINTARLYNIIQEMEDGGKQVIALILDYLKKIESTAPNGNDPRIRLGLVSKELKTLAQAHQIPVITAMQINREGNSVVDAAMREDKTDLARFVGSANVGVSWEIIEESDWVCVINLETHKQTNELYLTFKRVKIRGKKVLNAMDYFNHPFANVKGIRLETDVDKSASLSLVSLASDMAPADMEMIKSSQSRPSLAIGKKKNVLQAIGLSEAF